MPKALGKNLHSCFTKLKTPLSPPPSPTPRNNQSSTSSSSPSSSSSVLIKNFNSLYDHTPQSLSRTTTATCCTTTYTTTTSSSFSTDSDQETTDPPDLAAVFASQRFFFSSPGRSNSIIDDDPTPPESDTLVAGGVPTATYSPDPYSDFRQSMQEMVDARHLFDVTRDWDFLHELLLCYLALNPKTAHKHIIGAFADLLVSLTSDRKSEVSDRCTVSSSSSPPSSSSSRLSKD